MDVSQLVVEFKALHEKAKTGELSAAEQARWAELLQRLSAPAHPGREPREWDPETEPLD